VKRDHYCAQSGNYGWRKIDQRGKNNHGPAKRPQDIQQSELIAKIKLETQAGHASIASAARDTAGLVMLVIRALV